MTGLCEIENCQFIARVMAGDVDGGERLLCILHWNAAEVVVPGELQAAHLIAPPACFVYRCERDAVTIVGRYDEHPRPVCQRHLDDLSWVELPQELVLDRRPGRG